MDGNFLQTTSVDLQMLFAFFQVLSAIVMVGITTYAILWAKRQVVEAKKARVLSAYLIFESRLTNDQARDDRQYLYENNFENPSLIDDDDKEIIERVCATFDILGVLVREELMYRPLVFKPFYDVIIKCWKQTYDFIEFQRKPSRKAETYMHDFEYLYEEAEKFRLENKFPEVIIHPPNYNNPLSTSPYKRGLQK